ncbi:methyl-accepting chemotaxis protein [Paenibacillus chibensis]|uniref:Methyl-accepting chemotaxis protein n=1 Tax=Paenibacillus chibensis TaxID=59846 RepID=A0ABU6PN08_9BACL|nr:methyl-accepting chemotaxis protein [Paenibacillus chibensis]
MTTKQRFRIPYIGVKLFLIIVAAVVLLSAAVGLISYQTSKSIITEQVSASSTLAVAQAADKLDFLFQQYEGLSRQLAVDSTLKSDMETISRPDIGIVEKNTAEERIRRRLDSIKSSDDRLLGVRLVSKSLVDSMSYKSSGISNLRSDEGIKRNIGLITDAGGQTVWFPAQQKGFFSAYAEPTLTLGRLLRNMKNPQAEYILLFEIKEQALDQMLAGLKLGESGHTVMLDSAGNIVHAMDRSQLGQAFGLPIGKTDGLKEGSLTAADQNGEEQIVVYKPLGSTKWLLVGYAPVSDFVKGTHKLLYATIIVIVAAVALALLIGWYAGRSVGRPLGKLCKLMEEGENGNLAVRTRFRRGDEIGRLGQSFNRMMEHISGLVQKTQESAQAVLDTAGELQQASRSTSMTAGELALASRGIAEGAAHLAAESETESTLAEGMTGKMSQVAEANGMVESAAALVRDASGQGADYMKQLVHKTGQLVHRSHEIVRGAEELKGHASSIDKLLELMNTITKQTNILSMNAAIEAARAGSAGRGFMVVADQIRLLAEESKQSIRMAAEMTGDITRGVEQTVESLTAVLPVYDEQLQSVQEASSIFQSVKHQMDDVLARIEGSSASIDDVSAAQQMLASSIGSIGSVVEETMAATEEVAAMSSQQHSVSEKLVALSVRLEETSRGLQESMASFRI